MSGDAAQEKCPHVHWVQLLCGVLRPGHEPMDVGQLWQQLRRHPSAPKDAAAKKKFHRAFAARAKYAEGPRGQGRQGEFLLTRGSHGQILWALNPGDAKVEKFKDEYDRVHSLFGHFGMVAACSRRRFCCLVPHVGVIARAAEACRTWKLCCVIKNGLFGAQVGWPVAHVSSESSLLAR
jgi:hypothetical protein